MNNMKRKIAAMLTIIAMMSVTGGLLSSACAVKAKTTSHTTADQHENSNDNSKLKTLNSPYVSSSTDSVQAVQNEED